MCTNGVILVGENDLVGTQLEKKVRSMTVSHSKRE